MNDREILELAAKAADYRVWVRDNRCDIWHPNTEWTAWNPLTDDGDALRLAVKLRLDVGSGFNLHNVDVCMVSHAELFSGCFEEVYGKDPYVATRRAIVRAAAEIGKSLK